MADHELFSFVTKLLNLRRDGNDARLTLECRHGKTFIDLQLYIDNPPGPAHPRPRPTPSRLRRRARREHGVLQLLPMLLYMIQLCKLIVQAPFKLMQLYKLLLLPLLS